MDDKKEVDIFTDRNKWLVEAAGTARKMYQATLAGCNPIYGLASSEHRFLLAVARHHITVERISSKTRQALFVEALKEESAYVGDDTATEGSDTTDNRQSARPAADCD